MNTKDFLRLGVPLGEATRRATDFVAKFILGGGDKSRLHEEVAAIVANPSAFVDDPLRGEFAKALLNAPPPPRAEPVKYRQWGEGLEHEAVMQMEKACLLPVAVAGALMPDAHVGYGLPIGGVLATDNAVIPYAVGVDIACRMKMTVLDIPVRDLEQQAGPAHARHRGGDALRRRREFQAAPRARGAGRGLVGQPGHETEQGPRVVATRHERQRKSFRRVRPVHGAWEDPTSLKPGTYVALLSHSGSRGTGAAVCDHYSKLAFSQFPGSAERIEAARVAVAGFAGRPGILGGDGIDGPLRRGEPRVHPPAHRGKSRRAGAARSGEPPQLRVEGEARHRRRRARGHRASQRRDAGGRGRAGHHSRLDGVAGLRRERQGQRGIVELGVARRGPRDEPQGRQREIQLEGREPVPARARRDA